MTLISHRDPVPPATASPTWMLAVVPEVEVASRRHDAYFELLDLRDNPLLHLDEPLPSSFGQYQNEHT